MVDVPTAIWPHWGRIATGLMVSTVYSHLYMNVNKTKKLVFSSSGCIKNYWINILKLSLLPKFPAVSLSNNISMHIIWFQDSKLPAHVVLVKKSHYPIWDDFSCLNHSKFNVSLFSSPRNFQTIPRMPRGLGRERGREGLWHLNGTHQSGISLRIL